MFSYQRHRDNNPQNSHHVKNRHLHLGKDNREDFQERIAKPGQKKREVVFIFIHSLYFIISTDLIEYYFHLFKYE